MQTTIYLGLIRHLLTIAGGLLVSKGYLSSDLLEQVIGALIAIAGTAWSSIEKIQVSQASSKAIKNAAQTGNPATPVIIAPSNPGIEQP